MDFLVFLDYDGTLTPIVKKPHLAKMSRSRKDFLRRLARLPWVRLAVISGRQLSDLKQRLKIKGLYYAGNHGFEMSGPGLHLIHPKAKAAKPLLKQIKKALQRDLGRIKGALIEDKGLTLSVHYRLVRASEVNNLEKAFHRLLRPYIRTGKVKVTRGKKVLEIRPNIDWHKGKAVKWFIDKLCRRKYCLPVYIGDDTTDEDAFKAIGRNGITIRVGRARTAAQYRIDSIDQVYGFLRLLRLAF